MKILICGSNNQAEYVAKVFSETNNKIVILSDNEKEAESLSKLKNTTVFLTDPTKIYSFEIADVYEYDVIISLLDKDADNYVSSIIGKRLFNIKKSICTINNPNNVELFKNLGIDSPISAPYLLSEKIQSESDINSLIKTMSLENQRVVITEIKVKKEFFCANKKLKDISLPITGNITCIFREPSVVIPRGDTTITPGDILIIASAPSDQDDLVTYIRKGK